MHEKLLNIKEVAEYLSLSEEKVKHLVSTGDIPAYKIAGLLLRFKKEQIEEYKKGPLLGGSGETTAVPFRIQRSAGAHHRDIVKEEMREPYSFAERLEDFLYYNDFYILSLILFALVLFAIFEI